jgi:hypothetical protein
MVTGGLQEARLADGQNTAGKLAYAPIRRNATLVSRRGTLGASQLEVEAEIALYAARKASSLALASSMTCSSLFIARPFSIGAASGPAG